MYWKIRSTILRCYSFSKYICNRHITCIYIFYIHISNMYKYVYLMSSSLLIMFFISLYHCILKDFFICLWYRLVQSTWFYVCPFMTTSCVLYILKLYCKWHTNLELPHLSSKLTLCYFKMLFFRYSYISFIKVEV